MFTELPVEIALSVLAYLPISSIHSLQLVSKHCDGLVKLNESTIYRSAAVVHEFTPVKRASATEHLGRSEITNGPEIDWKAFCQRLFQLDRNWRGIGTSSLVCYPSAGIKPACIRVDEEEGFLINVTDVRGENRGLIVVDKENEVLWEQSWDFTQTYIIEYQYGYLVFNTPGWREVWRLASIPDPVPPADAGARTFPYPPTSQLETSQRCFEAHKDAYPKGHFVPHAALPYGSEERAFRLTFPTLLAKHNEEEAHLYDIPSRRLIRKISLCSHILVNPSGETTSLPPMGNVWTIDHSQKHVFLTSAETGVVRVLDKERGDCVLNMGNSDNAARTFRCEENEADTTDAEKGVSRLNVVEVGINEFVSQTFIDLSNSKKLRVSTCGNHFVTLRSRWTSLFETSSQLVVVRNFTDIPAGDREELSRHAIEIDLEAPQATFAFDGRRRVLICTRDGVWILDISKFLEYAGDVEAYSVPAFRDGSRVHTAELTESGVYFDWDAQAVEQDRWDEKMKERVLDIAISSDIVCGVNFAVREP
ncbi:hypothetical protein V5O48_006849 [Marasmius crinis-equi]|uniref:F-box domain-containing protein n=1 Tax=Marasmius crinis-equi TaxID=585013 RepID=A0ABR3FJ54_9AGAR